MEAIKAGSTLAEKYFIEATMSDVFNVYESCHLENETVWLTQQLMADLFQTSQQNISLHIQNIYEEGELAPEATYKKKYLSVRREGVRDVKRSLDYFDYISGIPEAYNDRSSIHK